MTTMESGSYRLELDEQKHNVFVTQLGNREDEEEDVRRYPVVKESAGKLIETGLNTMQKTLLLKREVEVEKANLELRAKRAEFQRRMGECDERRLDLQKKQQRMTERVKKFDKFINENEAKRKRAIQKYQTELKLKEQKSNEHEVLIHQLEELKIRHKKLLEKLQRYKIYEDYLMKVLDILPENYLEVNDSMLHSLMDRHRTLSATNQVLVERVGDLYDQLEKARDKLDDTKYKHNQRKLVINAKLAELQGIQEERVDTNTHLEEVLMNERQTYRSQSQILGTILMAIDNLAERCHKKHDPPLETLGTDGKLTLIQNYFVERIGVEKMARLSPTSSPTASLKDGHAGAATTGAMRTHRR
ncbi:coiled-coil domain-containing protein 42 homolog [Ptychodera flava]|uniref:coiled-coil domain-containing protein 42 homolog n=1 Tax=Ptychodera flava TaxID=63121 RepID=UPI00396A4041